MMVLTKDRHALVNINNMLEITLNGEYIQAIPLNNTMAITLGRYDTDERAQKVFIELASYPADGLYRMPCS